jgi:predicted phage terminase large subunit-like protein
MSTIEKQCPKCATTTKHTPLGQCLECEHKQAVELMAATKALRAEENQLAKARAHRDAQVKKKAIKKALKTRELTEKERARQELAKRELAKRHLLAFIMRYEPTYEAGWFHKVLAEALMQFLEDVIAGKSPRLIITVPPRHGKSMQASQYFPAWALGNHPHLEFINTSYAQSLQMDFSRKIQELVRSPDFKLLFDGLQIMKNNEAVERWGLADKKGVRTGGGVLAAGVGGPITGRGAHVLIIDDPVKNREEAESITVREGAKNWYSSTAYTRLAPGGGVLVIQTRWHDDDLAGWLLSEMWEAQKELKETGEWPDDADRWTVLDFPAIATHDEKYRKMGEPLHETRYPLPALKKIKRTLAPRDWAALYQQNPQVEEGAYFAKNMIRYYPSNPPKFLDVYAAGDLAISKKEHADYTVFMVAGVDEHENIYILDEYRGRGWDADKIIDVMFEIHKKWKPRKFGLEKGHISMTMDSHLERRKKEAKLYDLHVEELKPGKADKELRARSIQGLMSLGKVFWPQGALWVDDHLNEMLRFPNGVKDDRVDADAWIGKMLANQAYVGTGRPKENKSKDWRKKLAGYVKGHKSDNSPMAA